MGLGGNGRLIRARLRHDSPVWRIQEPIIRRRAAAGDQICSILERADECVSFLVLGRRRFFPSRQEGEGHDDHAQDRDTDGDEFAAARVGQEVGREGVGHRGGLVLAHGDGFPGKRQAPCRFPVLRDWGAPPKIAAA